jgi:hypothetical protein
MNNEYNNSFNDSNLLNPIDINDPIEGLLISDEEKKIAPIL